MEETNVATETAIETETEQVNQEGAVNQDKTTEDTATGTEGDGTPEKQFYTLDEMKSLDPEQLDTSRIPPEAMPIYKSLQGNYTRKYMEIAEERKRLTEEKRLAESKPAEPSKPKDIYGIFDANPQQIMTELSALISQEKASDPFSDKVIRLEMLKDDLLFRATQITQNKITEKEKEEEDNALNNKVYASLKKDIQGFDDKIAGIIEYAKELGYTQEQFGSQLFAPRVGVENAVKFMKVINKMYDMANAGKTAEGKINLNTVKPNSAGAGGGAKKTSPDAKAAYEKAREIGTTDAWAEYFTYIKQFKEGG